jgi:hypothetical protein
MSRLCSNRLRGSEIPGEDMPGYQDLPQTLQNEMSGKAFNSLRQKEMTKKQQQLEDQEDVL